MRPTDTAATPYGVGTFASRVAVLASASATHAAGEVRKKVELLAECRDGAALSPAPAS